MMGTPWKTWEPFQVAETEGRIARSPLSREGLADRLRAAAAAEIQAREAFLWAAARFPEAPRDLRRAWLALAEAEDRHLGWLLGRMADLGLPVDAKPVCLRLWSALTRTGSPREFALLMACAEERGRRAGEAFKRALAPADSPSAELFGRIAEEEAGHIALARRFFPG